MPKGALRIQTEARLPVHVSRKYYRSCTFSNPYRTSWAGKSYCGLACSRVLVLRAMFERILVSQRLVRSLWRCSAKAELGKVNVTISDVPLGSTVVRSGQTLSAKL